jgi:hypothetical protein
MHQLALCEPRGRAWAIALPFGPLLAGRAVSSPSAPALVWDCGIRVCLCVHDC